MNLQVTCWTHPQRYPLDWERAVRALRAENVPIAGGVIGNAPTILVETCQRAEIILRDIGFRSVGHGSIPEANMVDTFSLMMEPQQPVQPTGGR